MKKDIRWKQRFQNFERAFIFLNKSCKLESYDELQGAGLVQSFEFTFELAWKTLKDYIEYSGIVVEETTPRKVIKKAFESNVIKNGELWIKMLIQRNLLSHTYNQETFDLSIKLIKNDYINLLEDFYLSLKEKDLD